MSRRRFIGDPVAGQAIDRLDYPALNRAIDTALGSLVEEDATIVMHRLLEGDNFTQVATVTHFSERHVRRIFSEAMSTLKDPEVSQVLTGFRGHDLTRMLAQAYSDEAGGDGPYDITDAYGDHLDIVRDYACNYHIGACGVARWTRCAELLCTCGLTPRPTGQRDRRGPKQQYCDAGCRQRAHRLRKSDPETASYALSAHTAKWRKLRGAPADVMKAVVVRGRMVHELDQSHPPTTPDRLAYRRRLLRQTDAAVWCSRGAEGPDAVMLRLPPS